MNGIVATLVLAPLICVLVYAVWRAFYEVFTERGQRERNERLHQHVEKVFERYHDGQR